MPSIKLAELHPIIVHFPIALLFTSVALDILALFLRRAGLVATSSWCLLLGVIGALAAGITGEISSRVTIKSPQVAALVDTHQHVAILSGVIFSFVLVLRVVWLSPHILRWLKPKIPALAVVDGKWREIMPMLYLPRTPRGLIAVYLAVSIFGLVLLGITGYLGGVLVYDYGLGTPSGGLLPLFLHWA